MKSTTRIATSLAGLSLLAAGLSAAPAEAAGTIRVTSGSATRILVCVSGISSRGCTGRKVAVAQGHSAVGVGFYSGAGYFTCPHPADRTHSTCYDVGWHAVPGWSYFDYHR